MTLTPPYFSIIIPCLNEADYLPRLLDNLNHQTFTSFETIVVDGRSSDSTPTIVKTFPANFPLQLITSKKRSVSVQRNLGARHSSAKTLIFLDADTQIPPNYFYKLHHAFETKHPHILNTWAKTDSSKSDHQLIIKGLNLVFELSKLIGKPTCNGSMIAVKRGVFEDIGGFDEQTPYAEDSQFVQTVAKHNYKYLILPTPRYIYSLRRFNKLGTQKHLNQLIQLSLNLIAKGYHNPKVNYPMGGQEFKNLS